MSLLDYTFRFLRYLLAALLLIVVLLVAGIAYLGYTTSGNQFLADRVAALISTPDMQISLHGASGLLEGRFHLDRATIADTKGKFAEIEGLDIFWTPSELLRFRFHANRIAAAKVSFDRPPVKTIENSEPSQSSSSSFSLPVEVKVDSFDLPLIALGEAIAKRDTVLALNGSAQVVSDRIALDLNAVEKDRLNATARAKVTYAVNAKTLTLDGAIAEPQGGLLARLLALPGAPPVEIAVKGDGPLDDWKGSIGGRVDGKDVLQLSGAYRRTAGGIHEIALNGGGQISDFLPPQFRSLFTGQTKVDVNARFAATGLVDIRDSSITNDSFTLVANGELDPQGQARLTGELSPVKDVIHLDLPLASGTVKADVAKANVTLSGAFDQATLDISAMLASLATPQVQAGDIALTAHSTNLNLAEKTGTVSYDLGIESLAVDNANAAKVIQAPVKLKGTIDIGRDRIVLAPSDLESAKLGGKISGSFAPSTQAVAANFNLFLLPQGLLPPNIEAKIQGTLGLSGEMTGTLPSVISVQNLKLTSNLLTATGSASLDGETIKASLAGDIANLGDFADKAAGKAHFALDASGPLAKPDISAQVTSAEIRFADKSVQTVDLTMTSALDLNKPGGKLMAKATYLGQVITIEADAVFDNGLVSIPALKVDIGTNSLAGAVSLDKAFLPTGKIQFDFPDITGLAKLAGQTADGALKGTIDLAPTDGKISGAITAVGPRLSTAGAVITNPDVKIQISDLLAQKLSGKIAADSIASGSNHLDSIALDIAMANGQIPFDLNSTFDGKPLLAKGEIAQLNGGLTIRLASFSGAPRQIDVKLAAPTEIIVQNGIAQLNNLTIAAGTGSVIVKGSAGKALNLTATVTDLPLSPANAFARGLDAAGQISAHATIAGDTAKPDITFDADISGLATSQTRKAKLPALNILAKGHFADNRLTANATSTLRDQPTKIVAEVRLDNGAVSVPSFRADVGATVLSGTLAIDAKSQPSGKISFDIPDANALASIVGQKAEGAVKGTIDIASTSGKIDAKVDATGAVRGQAIKALVETTLDNGRVALPALKVDIGANTLSGAITLNDAFLPSGKISFDFPDVALLAAMAGQQAEGSIKGSADITSADGKIDAKLTAIGTIRNQAIDVQTNIVSTNGVISAPSLDAKIGANALSGAITLDRGFMPSGKIEFDFPDMALLAAMAGQKAEGAVKGTADLASANGRIDAKVAATGLIRNQTINLQTDVVADNGAISVPSLKANVGANTLAGAVALDKTFMPSGQFSFDFPDVGLLAAFAGQQADGALKGTAVLQSADGKISGKINAAGETLSTAGARIVKPVVDLDITDLAMGQLSGHVTAEQIASGNNRLDQLALNVTRAGPETRFDLTSAFDGAPMTADGVLKPDNSGLKLTLSSFSAAPRKIPLKLAKPVDILIKDGAASLGDLVIEAGKGSIAVTGTAGKTLDITAKVTALPLSLANVFSPGLDAAGAISADITIAGDAAAPVIDFDTHLQDIATSQTRNAKLPDLTIAAKGRFADNTLSITADSMLRDQAVKAAADVKLTGGRVTVPSFKADIGKSEFSGALTFDPKFQPSGKIAFDIPDANALASIIGQKAEGAIKGTADIASNAGKISVKLNASGKIREQAIKALADLNLDKGAISLPSLTLDIGKNALAGAVTLDRNFMPSGKFDFDFPDVALLAAMAGQKAEGSIKGTADIKSEQARMDAKITATGTIRKQAIDINVEAIREDGVISLPSLKLDVGKNTLSGALALDPKFMPSGKISFDLPDIALLAAFAGQKAEGAIKGSADITTKDGKISGTISANGTRLVAAGAEILKPVVDLKIADIATGEISGKVTADRIAQGNNALSKLALDLNRSGNKTTFDLKSQYDAAPLAVKGAIEQQADGIVVSLDSFSAAPKKIPVKLNKPTQIRIKNGAVSLSNLAITAGSGSIIVTGAAGNKLDLIAKVTALPASLANAFSPGLDAAGTISANVTVKGEPTAPTVAFDTTWQNAAISQTRTAGLAAFSVTAKGQLAKNVLSINTTAKGGNGLSLTAGGTIGITGNRALNIKVNGQLPFAAIEAPLAAQGIDLNGNARFDLTVTGAATSPSISGRITTSGATLTVIRQNLTIKNLAVTVNLDGQQARIANLKGNLAGGGTLGVSGTVGIAPNSGFPADLKITLKNAVYTDGKVVAAKLNGDLTVTGSLVRSPALKGAIHINRADITIPQKLPGTLAQIEIKHVHAPADVLIQAKEIRKDLPGGGDGGTDTGGLALDLKIIAPRQIFVRGRGLDAELGGTVNISGTSRTPNVTGGFKMQRGRLSIIGRRLDFSQGEISFGGKLTPALNMTATSIVEATTVNVIVSGLANNPNVAFTSSPALPQDEVMALLIFGRNSSALSPVQIAQLADAVSTLAGGQSNSLFAKLRQGLGVDDLDLGTDENGKSNVSVGKYLNKRTYLQLQQGVDKDTTSKAIINLDVGKGVKLRGEAGSDGSTAGGVFFEKEY